MILCVQIDWNNSQWSDRGLTGKAWNTATNRSTDLDEVQRSEEKIMESMLPHFELVLNGKELHSDGTRLSS